MMQLELNGQRYPVATGEMIVGSAPDAAVPLTGGGVAPRHLVVMRLAGGGVAVRRGEAGAETLVNGIRLGDEPTVLLHGDKVQIAGHELVAVEEERAGSTRVFDASRLSAVPTPRPGARREIGTANGRLVCLTDGREYAVGDGLVLGRDAVCDVVVTGHDVSRRHAAIRPTALGYVLEDESVNGTFVNGAAIGGDHLLARGDVIRIGADEFRFYADLPAGGAPAGAAERLNDTLIGLPGSPSGGPPGTGAAPASRPLPAPLASLLVRSGPLRGRRFPVRAASVSIGRAEYNDIVLAEESVSAAHARLQWRGGLWFLTDLGSTHGTAVDGVPVEDEVPLGPGATIRFGDLAVLFEPFDRTEPAAPALPAGTAAAAASAREPGAMEPEAARPETPRPDTPRPEVVERIRPPKTVPAEPTSGRGWLLYAGIVLIVVGVLAFLLMQ